jgi:hypothetical protein
MFTQADHAVWAILAAILTGSSATFDAVMMRQRALSVHTNFADLYDHIVSFVANNPKFTSELIIDLLTKNAGPYDTKRFLDVLDEFAKMQDLQTHFSPATSRSGLLALYLSVYNDAEFPMNLSMYQPKGKPGEPRRTYNLLADHALAITLKTYREERPVMPNIVRAHLLVKLGIYAGIFK